MAAPPVGKRRERARLAAAAALSALALVLLALLVVALDTPPGSASGGEGGGEGGGRGTGSGTGSGSGSGSGNFNARPRLSDVAPQEPHDCTIANLIGGTLLGIGLLIPLRAAYNRRSKREIGWRALGGLAFVLLGLVFIVSCNYVPEPSQEPPAAAPTPGGGGGAGTGTGTGTGDGTRPVTETPVLPPLSFTLVAVLLAGLIVAAVAFYLLRSLQRRRTAGGPAPEDPAARARAEALLREAAALTADTSDPREAVVVAYARFLEACAILGVPRSAFETPREHAVRVPAEARLPPEAVEAIVEAYETVRFAERDPPPAAKARALAGLDGILARTATPGGGSPGR